MRTIAIVGGGASGLMAALTCGAALCKSHGEAQVILFEKNPRIGKKLLATGNGKCNLTNTGATHENYYGGAPEFVKPALEIFPPHRAMEFFEGLGLLLREEYGGRVFPYCGQASAVLDVLRLAVENAPRLKVVCGCEVTGLRCKAGEFDLSFSGDNKNVRAESVIIATGGQSAPSSGSDGAGFKLLKTLGHKIREPVPALCPIRTDNGLTRALRGIRFNGRVSAKKSGRLLEYEDGEILFTDYGISGTAVFSLSRIFYEHGGDLVLALDFMPEYGEGELIALLTERRQRLADVELENFLTGTVNKKIGLLLLKRAGVEKLTLPAKALTDAQIKALVSGLKGLELAVKGHNGWENAQVTAGGAYTGEFSPKTMESKIIPGLYATGEVMDIFGDCGGYNLQWAWASGYLAGTAAAKSTVKFYGGTP